MSRSRIDPLGISGETDFADDSRKVRSSTSQPTKIDRWLADQITSGFDASRLRIALWDEVVRVDRDTLPVVLQIKDRRGLVQLLLNPALNFGDLYSSGQIAVQGDLLVVLEEAYRALRKNAQSTLKSRTRRAPRPSLADSRGNIHHHYDISNDFYQLWLDREALQYTCAYYADAAMTLEQAQQAKMHHVCRKLQLKPGDQVVEAGGGWGGFAIFMAKNYGVNVRSFNISTEQIAHSRRWAESQGLSQRVEFVEDDFRNISGSYDVFVSIGMLEHVGPGNYVQLGKLVNQVLTPEGRGLIHTIGRDREEPLNPWIERRIFPGAYPPTLGQMMNIFEPNRLSVLDVENIRLHYQRTLEHWLQRYEENLDAVRSMFDESFVRAWRLYLAGSMVAFEHGTLQLFQVLFARSGVNSVPRTRAHIYQQGD